MFLLSRLIAISIYVLLTVVSVYILGRVKKTQTKIVLVAYLIILCIIAYLYYPYQTSDLYRVRMYVHDCASMSWSELFNAIVNGTSGLSSTPMAMVYYKIIGGIGNDNFIPAISCFIIYGMLFYILYDYKINHDISNKVFSMAIFLLMAMDFFMPSIATIRSYIATVLVVYCIYRENMKNKFGCINIILYLISLMMHNIGTALIIFRVIVFLIFNDNNKTKIKRTIGVVVVLVCAVLFYHYYSSMITTSISNAIGYIDGDVYSYAWEQMICIIQTIFIFVIMLRSYSAGIFKNSLVGYHKMLTLSWILLVIFNIEFSFLMRWCFFTEILALPAVMELVNVELINRKNRTYKLLFTIIFITLILACTRGYLCSLKFW